MAYLVIEDMEMLFLPRRKVWARDDRMWCMRCQLQEVQSRTEYILVTEHLLFQNIYGWNPLDNSDHYMVLGCLHGATQQVQSHYLWQIRRSPPPLSMVTNPVGPLVYRTDAGGSQAPPW